MTIIDCDTCPVRGRQCYQCCVPVVAGAWLDQGLDSGLPSEEPGTLDHGAARARKGPTPQDELALTDAEWEAVDAFIGAGLVNALDVLDLVARSESALTGSWLQVG